MDEARFGPDAVPQYDGTASILDDAPVERTGIREGLRLLALVALISALLIGAIRLGVLP